MTAKDEQHIEDLRKMIAFYWGEHTGKHHPLEIEYYTIGNIPPEQRTKKQTKRMIVVSRACAQAVDASKKAYHAELDKFVWTGKCRRNFSVCLDCELKNRCERYSKHLRGRRG